MSTRHPAVEPCWFVLFGVTGDLSRRKLLSSLWDLWQHGWLGEGFRLLGVARQDFGDEDLRKMAIEALPKVAHDPRFQEFIERFSYLGGDFAAPELYGRLRERLADGPPNVVYYLATPPSFYGVIADNLREAEIAGGRPGGFTRIVIEKPFGVDMHSARTLNEAVGHAFEEPQVFRIDHYLGKETVQNILVFRFANGIFEPVWNRSYIDHVQITVAEDLGLEGRAAYYEEAGALRDMVQNHMIQLLALTAMEPPVNFEADSVRNEKVKVLHAVRRPDEHTVRKDVVLGQYAAGAIDHVPVVGYREEQGVNPASSTDTFMAMRLYVDNWRWAGVPFYLRTGKRLPKRSTHIAIVFRRAPHLLFRGMGEERLEPNVLTLHIQPDEGISLSFGAKVPGQGVRLRTVQMDFLYGTTFRREPTDAYSRLLHDVMSGDSTLFTRSDEVEAAWEIVDPVLQAMAGKHLKHMPYPAGSWGPEAAEEMLHQDGRRFREP